MSKEVMRALAIVLILLGALILWDGADKAFLLIYRWLIARASFAPRPTIENVAFHDPYSLISLICDVFEAALGATLIRLGRQLITVARKRSGIPLLTAPPTAIYRIGSTAALMTAGYFAFMTISQMIMLVRSAGSFQSMGHLRPGISSAETVWFAIADVVGLAFYVAVLYGAIKLWRILRPGDEPKMPAAQDAQTT